MHNLDKLLTRARPTHEEQFDHNRTDYFQTMCNMLVSSRVAVSPTEAVPTAACKWDSDRNTHDLLLRDGEVPVSSDVASKIGKEERFVSLLCKEGMAYHEMGHVLFTDHDAWEETLMSAGLMERERLQRLLNVVEDAVIEAFLIEHFGIDRILALKNENKHKTIGVFQSGEMGDPTAIAPHFEDPIHPVNLAIMVAEEFGRFDLGIVKTHLDPNASERFELTGSAKTDIGLDADGVISETLDCLSDVSQEPVARKRYEQIADLFDTIYPRNAPNQGEQSVDPENISPDADEVPSGSEQQMGQFRVQTPDIESDDDESEESEESDAGESEPGSGQSSESGESGSEADTETGRGNTGDSPESDESDSQTGTGQSGEESDQIDAPDIGQESVESSDEQDIDEQSGVVEDGEESVGGEAVDSKENQSSQQISSDELESAFKAAGAGSDEITVRNPEQIDADVSSRQVAKAKRMARSVESIVDDYLHQRERSRESKDELWGQFDDSNLVNAARGSPRSFKREDKPDELDYHAVIMCDESGSMRGDDMQAASTALAALTKGFEDAGIDVDVFRFGRKGALVKTAAEPYEDVEQMLLDRTTRGSTVLHSVLEQVEGRADLQQKESFGVVLTDGLPNNKASCKEKIRQIDIPMLSIQIKQETDYFDGVYDAIENVNSSDEVSGALRTVIRQSVFK